MSLFLGAEVNWVLTMDRQLQKDSFGGQFQVLMVDKQFQKDR